MLDDKGIEELSPVAHRHMAMLTSSGVPPATALAIAAHVCAAAPARRSSDAQCANHH